jgi:hypothetical protein
MSRRPTKPITWAFVLRTFKRVGMIAARHSPEAIAKAMVERGVAKALGQAEYMSDVADYMRSAQREAGVDPNAHPNGNCPQCGDDIGRDHNGARYCSRECRQRAYRVRKAAAEGRNSPIAKRSRTKPTAREAAMEAARAIMARKNEAAAFASSMYALHLKAHPDEEKGSIKPQGDTSSSAESETNVTQSEREAEAT